MMHSSNRTTKCTQREISHSAPTRHTTVTPVAPATFTTITHRVFNRIVMINGVTTDKTYNSSVGQALQGGVQVLQLGQGTLEDPHRL